MAAGLPGGGLRFPDAGSTLRVLKNHGFDPQHALDLGAYNGDWTRMFHQIFPQSKILMVEPQAAKQPILQAVCATSPGQILFEPALLGARADQEVTFYVMESGSSILPELTDCPRTAVRYKTTTVDVLLAKRGVAAVDFIKLDAQGFELEILKGAAQALARVQAVYTEVSLIPFNEGGPLAAEVVKFFEESGFQLADICSDMRREDQVPAANRLFVRPPRVRLVPPARIKRKPSLTYACHLLGCLRPPPARFSGAADPGIGRML